MKHYSSFLIRCWFIEEGQHGERSVIDVQHIQSGGRTRVASLAEAEGWMFGACRYTQSAPATASEGGQETVGRERDE